MMSSELRTSVNMKTQFYNGNPKLKRTNVELNLTKRQKREMKRCQTNVSYFVKNYLKVVNVDDGLVPLDLYDYQEKLIEHIHDHRYSIVAASRQCGKCLESEQVINVKNKITGEKKSIKIGDLYKMNT